MTTKQKSSYFASGFIIGAVATGALTAIGSTPVSRPCKPTVTYARVHAEDRPGTSNGLTLEAVCPAGTHEGPPPSVFSQNTSYAQAINGIQAIPCLPNK